MARTAFLSERGLLREPSIVGRPAARLYAGIPNAYLGLAYYPLVAIAFAFDGIAGVRIALSLLVAAALATTLRLVYDLVASKSGCPNCWTAHACNLTLAALTASSWVRGGVG